MGHYSGMFNDQNLVELLDLLSKIKGKFMLTMYPNETIKQYVDNNDWKIHEIERVVTASRSTRRPQKEWMIVNY
jgi:DNA adenine methylase